MNMQFLFFIFHSDCNHVWAETLYRSIDRWEIWSICYESLPFSSVSDLIRLKPVAVFGECANAMNITSALENSVLFLKQLRISDPLAAPNVIAKLNRFVHILMKMCVKWVVASVFRVVSIWLLIGPKENVFSSKSRYGSSFFFCGSHLPIRRKPELNLNYTDFLSSLFLFCIFFFIYIFFT